MSQKGKVEAEKAAIIAHFEFLIKIFNPTRLACPQLIFPNPDREKYKNVQFKFDRDNFDVENLNHYTLEEVKPDMIVEHTCEKTPLPSSLSIMPQSDQTISFKQIRPKPETFPEADDYGFHVHN